MLVGRPDQHGLPSLVVNRTRPIPVNQVGLGTSMPRQTPSEIIVIDDEDNDDPGVGPSNRPNARSSTLPQLDGTPGRQPWVGFVDLTSSPELQRHAKRPRLSSVDTDNFIQQDHIGADFPHTQEEFENAFMQAYPNFFEDALVQHGSPEFMEDVVFNPVQALPKKPVEPPYFHDPKLDVRMFRGPGYAHFPVPIDADPKFKQFCDDWNETAERRTQRRMLKQTRHNAFGPYVDESIAVEDSDDDDKDNAQTLTPGQADCLAKILEVLPGIQHQFAVSRIKMQHESWSFGNEEIEVVPDSNVIVEQILGLETYPKRVNNTSSIQDPFEAETGKIIKWDIDNRKHKDYRRDAIVILASQFEHVPTHYIDRTLKDKKSLWDTYRHIENDEINYFQTTPRPYYRSSRPRTQLEKKYRRPPQSDPKCYTSLICELQAVKQHNARENLKKGQEEEKANSERKNLEQHKADGTIVECQICFDDEIPINRAVTCTASSGEHSFCFDCVGKLADTQVGLMKYEMVCMDESGCKEKLDMESVGRAIPIKTFDRLLFNQQQAEIAAANLEGLEQCPFCDFKAICDPVETDTTFSCQSPACFKVTCRKCHEISHLPKTCEEAKKDRKLDVKHRIEEARSAAMMRPCPKCKTNLIKELGCNKMRCQCGAVMCYVCKQDLSDMRDGYAHFNGSMSIQKPKCPLYDRPEIDRHVQEANEAEIKAIKEAKDADETIEEDELRIETGKSAQPNVPPNRAGFPGYRGDMLQFEEDLRRRGRRRNRELIERPEMPHIAYPLPNLAAAPQPLGQANNVIDGAGLNDRLQVLAAQRAMNEQGAAATIEAWRNQIIHPNGILAVPDVNDMLDAEIQAARNFARVERLQNFRADMDRRRQLQLQRRNNARAREHVAAQDIDPTQALGNHEEEVTRWLQPQLQMPQGRDNPFPQAHIPQYNDMLRNTPDDLPWLRREPGTAIAVGAHPGHGKQAAIPGHNWREQFRPPTPVRQQRQQEHQRQSPFAVDRQLPPRRRTVPEGPAWATWNDFDNDINANVDAAVEMGHLQGQARQQADLPAYNRMFGYEL
ncbi:hypothetical protein LTS08_003099 [Lithohypha guttulata]|nr:hypothetical protein LTS08_003099 [Lithohypha guttulata]